MHKIESWKVIELIIHSYFKHNRITCTLYLYNFFSDQNNVGERQIINFFSQKYLKWCLVFLWMYINTQNVSTVWVVKVIVSFAFQIMNILCKDFMRDRRTEWKP